MSHYIIMSMAKAVFEASFVRAQNGSWSQKNANIMNQLFFLQEVNAFASACSFKADSLLSSLTVTDTAKYVNPTSYADAMSRSDAKLWQEAFDKEMNGLVSRNVISWWTDQQIGVLLAPQ